MTTAVVSVLFLLASLFGQGRTADFDVRKYGAKADGQSDNSQALLKAWTAACDSPTPSKVVVPAGKYVVSSAVFTGPCKQPITFQHQGTFLAPQDHSKLKSGDSWISFRKTDRFTLNGGGTFDGQGTATWSKNQCTKTLSCKSLPTNIRFDFLTNSTVEHITSLNSKMFHINVLGCQNITLDKLTITAPPTSANTDGIHIGRSDGVTITGAIIKTGDDCVSIGDGSRHVTISGVQCGPGHGISVGSLGKYLHEDDVMGITVKNCTLTGTTNGVRIKTWPASPASKAYDMHFEDITMNAVLNPILIDQEYCPWSQCKAAIPSKVKISNVSFKNIRGTSATQNVLKLACSRSLPCDGVVVGNINLAYLGLDGPATSICSNVNPKISGKLPKGCTA